MINENLLKLIKYYTTKKTDEFLKELSSLSKPTLISVFCDLLTLYINDKNSSKLREIITAIISDCEILTEKLGYNGFRIETPNTKIFCEIKPKNVNTPCVKKLDGRGQFTDYTPERFEKDKKINLKILISGFIDGKLIYIIEIPFNCLEKHILNKLRKKFGDNLERKKGNYLRTLEFSYLSYKNCEYIELIFLSENIEEYKNCLTKPFYEFLKSLKGEKK